MLLLQFFKLGLLQFDISFEFLEVSLLLLVDVFILDCALSFFESL